MLTLDTCDSLYECCVKRETTNLAMYHSTDKIFLEIKCTYFEETKQ